MMIRTRTFWIVLLLACVAVLGCAPRPEQQGAPVNVPTVVASATVEALAPVVVEPTAVQDQPVVTESEPADGGDLSGEASVAETAVVSETVAVVADAGCPSENFLTVTADPNNGAYPDPTLNVTCTNDTVVIQSNTIPSFEFVAITPGDLQAIDQTYEMPLNPQVAAQTTDIPLLGPVAVAVDGLPIYGPNEAENLGFGDPYLDQILDFCNGHVGPTGYHYHARPDCLFDTIEEVGLVIGYALDGFPILSPYVCADENCATTQKLQSSWQRTSDAEAAWEAHEYVAGSGDLDRCNGRTLSDGSYAYFATDTFPYLLGCYVGTPILTLDGGGAPAGGNGEAGQQGGQRPGPDFGAAATALGVSEEVLREALGEPPPDFGAAAAVLGVSEEALREAIGPPPGR